MVLIKLQVYNAGSLDETHTMLINPDFITRINYRVNNLHQINYYRLYLKEGTALKYYDMSIEEFNKKLGFYIEDFQILKGGTH